MNCPGCTKSLENAEPGLVVCPRCKRNFEINGDKSISNVLPPPSGFAFELLLCFAFLIGIILCVFGNFGKLISAASLVGFAALELSLAFKRKCVTIPRTGRYYTIEAEGFGFVLGISAWIGILSVAIYLLVSNIAAMH